LVVLLYFIAVFPSAGEARSARGMRGNRAVVLKGQKPSKLGFGIADRDAHRLELVELALGDPPYVRYDAASDASSATAPV
jgi:hypothetical protein